MLRATGRLAVISGPGGMGKTALAVHWAHQVIDRFPDGQLFLDLRGHDPATAMPAAEALTHLLGSLGVNSDRTPASVTTQLGLYRSALRERRMLILLDNAGSAEQVAPLVPPDSASLLIVTSRQQLAGLALDHEVTTIHLDMLTHEDASTLLRRVLGREPGGAGTATAPTSWSICAAGCRWPCASPPPSSPPGRCGRSPSWSPI